MPFTRSQASTLLLRSPRSSQHSRPEGCAGVSREQGLEENGVVRLSHITLVCSPFPQVLCPGKQLLDQMPLYITTFQFCELSPDFPGLTSPAPPSAGDITLSGLALVSLELCTLSRSWWFPSTLWVRPRLPGMWLCLLLLPSLPTLTPRNSCASLHHFALTAGLFSSSLPQGWLP